MESTNNKEQKAFFMYPYKDANSPIQRKLRENLDIHYKLMDVGRDCKDKMSSDYYKEKLAENSIVFIYSSSSTIGKGTASLIHSAQSKKIPIFNVSITGDTITFQKVGKLQVINEGIDWKNFAKYSLETDDFYTKGVVK